MHIGGGPMSYELVVYIETSFCKIIESKLEVYHSFRNHYILDSKTVAYCNCNGRQLLKTSGM